jgi:spore germination protein GerM
VIRRVVSALLAALVVVVLTACAAIPTSGPVQKGSTVEDQALSGVDFRPDGPTKGSDQETILRQFIDAATGTQDDFAVAREFLTRGFAQRWDPRRSVTVRQGNGAVARTGDERLAYTLTAAATVDVNGQYTQADNETTSTRTFRFRKEGGQWRISSAPDGIILSPVNFESVFQPHALYFYDPTYRYLVPEERWFLARSSTSTRIASALLTGPSQWLKGAVVTAFPEGTQLSLNAVTIESGAARVDLTSDALKATSVEKVRMRDQLAASLASVASVSSVAITVEGTSLDVPASGATTPERDPDVDPRPLVVTKDAVGNATGTAVDQLPGIAGRVLALDPTSLELTATGGEAAVGNADGVYTVRTGGSAPIRVDSRPGLIAPSIDDQGYVWSAQASDPRSVTAFGLGGDPHAVTSTLPDGRLVAFRVSRDATRALALVDTAEGAALYVMAVIRDARREPTALGTPVRVPVAAGTPVDATWQSDLEVASLGSTATGSTVTTSTIGGRSTSLNHPTGTATAIVGGASGSLLLQMSDDTVLTASGGGWDDSGISCTVLGTQR